MGEVLTASSDAVRRRMQRQPSYDTQPELRLRSELHRQGFRYRLHRQVVPGTRRSVDLVFPTERVAVFVDGCFWHGCPEHGRAKHQTNAWYWTSKIERNRTRDLDTNERLAAAGWEVIRIWEHEEPVSGAERVAVAVRSRRDSMRTARVE